MSTARRGWSRRAYCLQLADFFRKLPDESLLIRRKDAVNEVKDAQGALLTLDAEIARRRAEVTTCHDPDCDRVGQDLRKCEHYVRLSDVEQPVVTNPPDSSQEPRVDCPFHDQCSEIVTRLRRLERVVHDIGRSAKGELL